MLVAIGALLLLGLFLLWLGGKRRKSTDLPVGKVVYDDSGARRAVEKPLYAPGLGLTGRPDYIVEKGEEFIPVEVKSTPTPPLPYEGHVMQALAYCLLVEEVWHKKAPYALIRYPERTFKVEFTDEYREKLLDVLAEMRRRESRGLPPRSHNSHARCRKCGFRDICDQRLD
jgi:CRISPR-associated exonuclease Cas4